MIRGEQLINQIGSRMPAVGLSVLLVASMLLGGCGRQEQASAQTVPSAEEAATSAADVPAAETPAAATPATDAPAADTIGGAYLAAFSEYMSAAQEKETDLTALAQALTDKNLVEYDLVQMPVEPGYLDGFDGEITAFSSGVKFSPMIGSIPFVGYVFSTEDSQALLRELTESANPRWNVCTEADETVSDCIGNVVFFLMCSNGEQ